MQGRTDVNAGCWEQANPKRPRQEECDDREEMQEESRMVRCTLLNGSTWSTEKKYTRRYKVPLMFFFGVVRKEEMEEQFNTEAKQGWRFAADGA